MITDINHFSDFNEIYESYFPSNAPARAVVEVSALPRNALIEVKFIAVRTE